MPNSHDGLIVVAAPLQLRDQRPRQRRATQRDEPFDLRGAENRQNARDDGHRDASPRQEIAALEVMAVLEEELGDDEVRSVIDLRLQPLPVQILALRQATCPSGNPATPMENEPNSRMYRTSSYEYSKPPSVATNSPSPSGGSPRSARMFLIPSSRVCSSMARVCSIVALTHVRCAIAVIRMLPLNPIDDRQRLLAGAPAGAVGDRAEIGIELAQCRESSFPGERAPLLPTWSGKNSKESTGRPATRARSKMSRMSWIKGVS